MATVTTKMWALGAAMLALPACDLAAIDTADATAPSVEIKVKKTNAYSPATNAVLTNDEPLELMAVATDAEGVRSLAVEFLGRTSDSCTVGSSVYGGAFPVPLPDDQEQGLKGNEEGKVLTSLPLLATVPQGPTCTVGTAKGRPIGHTFTVRATAVNWADDAQPVVATLKVLIQ